MFKRITILILILAVVLSLAAVEQKAIKSTFETLQFRLQIIDKSISSGVENINDVTNLISFWDSRKKVLYTIIPHIEIKNIEIYLYQLKNAVEYDKDFEASEYIEVLISQTKCLPKAFAFCFENIL